MLVYRPDCHRLAHGFNVAKKHWDSLTKPTDSEDLDAVLHFVVMSTCLFQHPHHHCFRSRQHKTGSRGGIINSIINIHVIINFTGNTLFFGLFVGGCQIGHEI